MANLKQLKEQYNELKNEIISNLEEVNAIENCLFLLRGDT